MITGLSTAGHCAHQIGGACSGCIDEALALARAEGFREGVEAAAKVLEDEIRERWVYFRQNKTTAELVTAIRALAPPADRGVLAADRGDLDADRGAPAPVEPRCERCDGTGNDGWCYRCGEAATGCSDCGGTGKPAAVEPMGDGT